MNDKLDLAEFGRYLLDQHQRQASFADSLLVYNTPSAGRTITFKPRKAPEPYADNPLYGSI